MIDRKNVSFWAQKAVKLAKLSKLNVLTIDSGPM